MTNGRARALPNVFPPRKFTHRQPSRARLACSPLPSTVSRPHLGWFLLRACVARLVSPAGGLLVVLQLPSGAGCDGERAERVKRTSAHVLCAAAPFFFSFSSSFASGGHGPRRPRFTRLCHSHLSLCGVVEIAALQVNKGGVETELATARTPSMLTGGISL